LILAAHIDPSQCKVCNTTESKKWYGREDKTCSKCYLKARAAKYSANRRLKYASDPLIRDANKQRSRLLREQGYKKRHKRRSDLTTKERGLINAAKQRYRERHPDRIKTSNKIQHAQHYLENQATLKDKSNRYLRTVEGQYSQLRSGSKRRGLGLSLSLEQYRALRCQPCHYCKKDLEQTGTCLDRRDNNVLVYSIDNSVPCCHKCNYIKADLLTESEMLDVTAALTDLTFSFVESDQKPTAVNERLRKQTYTKLTKSAIARQMEMVITETEYLAMASYPCYYCAGSLPIKGYGLDRKESNKGYTTQNCVPCCSFCNDLKGNILTAQETRIVMSVLNRMRGRTTDPSYLTD